MVLACQLDSERNLFSDLARIQLILSRKPLPRIGSLTINNECILDINNRLLMLEICHLENENIPIDIQRKTSYSTVDTYIHDLLSVHDNRLRYQPNGASSMKDCIKPDVCIDNDENPTSLLMMITSISRNLLTLEWACVRPIEMQHPPYWLTSQAVYRIDETQYNKMCTEYIDIFEQVEKAMLGRDGRSIAIVGCDFSYAELLKRLWEKGTFWYCFALDSLTGLHHIFYHRV
ncbi:hypothetical protein BDBG_05696 [Blastomyces gilchristii SLH14081]|uniref:Uncharacterized protein n=1 Tax=Blastomyces gilchristii (strain SLH14081) TaxID=559298 RepID=A0A179UQA4_BLAGS|nr:uncharacterized protein BDBG_05696 [Blastomyces gilchristii SLH14081]OAT10013.1 hypothetical protein BDBG_05696 [Blastomyces gilchristii SLH14081]